MAKPTKSIALKFHVLTVSTNEEQDSYSTAGRYGDTSTHRVGMNLVVSIQGTIDGVPAYLTRRVKFTRCSGLSNGDFYDLGANDSNAWGVIVREKGEVVTSTNPEMFPNAFALVHREKYETKIKPGMELQLKAIVTDKISRHGKAYKQLSRAVIQGES